MMTKKRRGEIAILFLKKLYGGNIPGPAHLCALDMHLRIRGLVEEGVITNKESEEFCYTFFRELDDEELTNIKTPPTAMERQMKRDT